MQSESIQVFAKANDTAQIIEKIRITAAFLKDSPDFLSPLKWRALTKEYGLPALDLPRTLGGLDFSTTQMSQIFEFIGQYSLNMRDMIGAGHARALVGHSNSK